MTQDFTPPRPTGRSMRPYTRSVNHIKTDQFGNVDIGLADLTDTDGTPNDGDTYIYNSTTNIFETGPAGHRSKIDQFDASDAATDVFTLTHAPIDGSWNLELNGLRVHGSEFDITGRALTVLDPADLFLGADVQGSPWNVEIQYDYLTEVLGTYPAAVIADTPLFYYRLDEPAGTLIYDLSGNARDGTLTGTGVTYAVTSLLPNDVNPALNFGSTLECYVLIPNESAYSVSAFTVEFLTNVGGSGVRDVFTHPGRMILSIEAGSGRWKVWNGSSYTTICSTDGSYTSGGTVHLAFTWDGATATFYRNGALYAAFTPTPPTILTASGSIKFGASNGNSGLSVGDEFAYFGHALTADRILAHWNAA